MKTDWIYFLKTAVGAWLLINLLTACTYDQIEPVKIPQPKVSLETENLEIAYSPDLAPNTVNSPYWLTADFKTVSVQNITINQVASEIGLLNVNGTYNGLTDFSEGTDLTVQLKAAYDDTYLYVLASWQDQSYSLSHHSWVYDGPLDPLKVESSDGWTSQRNDDNIVFEFDMGAGNTDVWKWSFALSEPLGYAIDMFDDGTLRQSDAGDPMFMRNVNGSGNTAGPMYEWDGVQQELERENGGFTILDPGYYLLNKEPFVGDVTNGMAIYQQECASCHGVEGDGDGFDWNTGYSMTLPGFLNRFSRQGFENVVTSSSHDGASHFTNLTTQEKDDLVAMIRGFTGVPGYYLQEPTGSNADVSAHSNVQLAQVNPWQSNSTGYKVLFIRKLITPNSDDIQMTDPEGTEVNFNIYLTNNDDINKVGKMDQTLIFKNQQ